MVLGKTILELVEEELQVKDAYIDIINNRRLTGEGSCAIGMLPSSPKISSDPTQPCGHQASQIQTRLVYENKKEQADNYSL